MASCWYYFTLRLLGFFLASIFKQLVLLSDKGHLQRKVFNSAKLFHGPIYSHCKDFSEISLSIIFLNKWLSQKKTSPFKVNSTNILLSGKLFSVFVHPFKARQDRTS